ncbi:MAG: PadR family transcriptional regulator [Clostridiales bacterium]|nr:PadR family transcriptional regulator [Clostridiales bacterium]
MIIKDEIPRGQLSTIILNTLLDKDKYGYEIIEEVLSKTNGKVSIKQPSLYSSLKRMEEQSLISSYWRDSEIGGRRHYYHLTDLGKKHLEKWQADIPLSFKENNTVKTTKVLQQENLFNLTSTTTENAKNNNELEQPQKDNSFIQFDLFSNSPIITPPSQDSLNLTNQKPIETKLIQEPKTYSFDYIKKTNKSFSDCLKNNDSYEKKYVSQTNILISEKQEIENVVIKEQEIKTESPTDKTISKIDVNVLPGYIGKKEVSNDLKELENLKPELVENKDDEVITNKDDGVIITERLNPEDMPKPTKWDNRRFEVYVAGNSVAPDLKKAKKVTYEDRVKDLYEKSIANAENQELELIDNKIKFPSYKDLQEFYSEQNIKFKPFQKSLRKTEKDYNMIRITKFNMLSSLMLFVYISLLSITFGIICSFIPNVKLHNVTSYLLFPILFLIYFICTYITYVRTPQKRIALDTSKFKFNWKLCLISILLIPVIFAINLLCGFTFVNFKSYCLITLYPIMLSLTYFIYFLFTKIILKSKSIY